LACIRVAIGNHYCFLFNQEINFSRNPSKTIDTARGLFSRAQAIGKKIMELFQTTGNTASSMVANLMTITTETFASLAPIVAILFGIALAFVIINYVIGFFKKDRGYAPGEFMAGMAGMTEEDKAYYLSDKYPGN
jgi:hypothetical protein